MKRLLSALLCLCFCVAVTFSLAACQSGSSDSDGDQSSPATSDSAEGTGSFKEIELGKLVLKYPGKWSDRVNIKVSENTAAFSSSNQQLFDIIIGESNEHLLGTTSDGTKVYLKTYKVKGDSELLAMQEDSNEIINNLIKDYKLSIEADKPTGEPCFATETSVATLYYPERWKNDVKIAEKDGKVTFSNGGTDLFAILYNSDKGELLGTYNDVTVSLENYKVSDEKHMMMQEAANDVLQHLYEDKKFKSAK